MLSGTASDGTLGLEAIKAEGGITFAQDDSAKYDSMPRSAVAAGCVDLVLSPADIAKELARIAKHPYVLGHPLELPTRAEKDHENAIAHQDDDQPLPSGGRGTPPTGGRQARDEAEREQMDPSNGVEDGYKKIMLLLRNHSGVDFSLYRSSTIQRRIARRIVLTRQDTLKGYARFLRGNTEELDSLFSDVLISVTSFFRNPEAFDVLQRDILPKLLAQRGDDPVRCWVLGCSTGQEAYSLAMSFVEVARKASARAQIPDLRHRSQREAPREGSPWLVREDARTGYLARAPAAVFRRGGRRLPHQQSAARNGRVRAAEPHRRSALLAHGPHQLPKSPDLSGSELAAEGDAHVPLRAQTPRILAVGRFGIRRRVHEPLRAGGQEA